MAANDPIRAIFGNDRPLLYDVSPWNGLGFAVANFSRQVGTLSQPIWALADEVGKSQLMVMTHIDAQRTQYPSLNTIKRICKLYNRVKSVLGSRQKSSMDTRLEEGHATADLKPWQLHPVPYFVSSITRNNWLSQYNRLCMIALTNIYQHSDNNLSLTVTTEFAAAIWQYFQEIGRLLGIELLGLDPAVVDESNFTFSDASYAGYASITDRVLSYEPLDSAGPIASRATEADLNPLFTGFPATALLSVLRQYPVDVSTGIGFQGQAVPLEGTAVGVQSGTQVAPAGLHIGEPQV